MTNADELEPVAHDDALTIAFSVVYRGTHPTGAQFMTRLLRRCIDLAQGEWYENLDSYDSMDIETEEKLTRDYPEGPSNDDFIRAWRDLGDVLRNHGIQGGPRS